MKQKSMVRQVQEALQVQLRIGEKRHDAKKTEHTHSPAGIFSYRTFETYMKQGCAFAKWAKLEHGSRTLAEARPYVESYLQSGIDRGLSAYTLSTQRAALCKLYGCTARDFAIQLPERRREDIQRSRKKAARDYGFSKENNADILAFARVTGLRRHELAAVKPEQIRQNTDGSVTICQIKGKGGKVRDIDVLLGKEEAVLKFAGNPAGRPVFSSVPSHMDVHGCRREYANAMYHSYQEKLWKTEGRDFRNLPPIWELRPVRNPDGSYLKKPDGRRVKTWQLISSYYRCKKDRRGVVYDKKVMLYVSRQLGHNRISVVAGHYLGK